MDFEIPSRFGETAYPNRTNKSAAHWRIALWFDNPLGTDLPEIDFHCPPKFIKSQSDADMFEAQIEFIVTAFQKIEAARLAKGLPLEPWRLPEMLANATESHLALKAKKAKAVLV